MIRASRRITMAWTGQRGTLCERGIARRNRSIESPEWDSQSPSGLEVEHVFQLILTEKKKNSDNVAVVNSLAGI